MHIMPKREVLYEKVILIQLCGTLKRQTENAKLVQRK